MFHKRIKMEYYDECTLCINFKEVEEVTFIHDVVQANLVNLN